MHNQIKKILLIQPPCTISRYYTKEIQPPLGLAYIAACLEKNYEVRILDAACEGWEDEETAPGGLMTYGLSFDTIKERIKEFSPDVVGVSCLFKIRINLLRMHRRDVLLRHGYPKRKHLSNLSHEYV